MLNHQFTRSLISGLPVLGFWSVEILIWGTLFFIIPESPLSLPLAFFLLFFYPIHPYLYNSSKFFSKTLKKELEKKYGSRGVLANYNDVKDWKEKDELEVKFWRSVKNRKGEEIYWKEVEASFNEPEYTKFYFRGISSPNYFILEDISGDLHEVHHCEFLDLENKTHKERLNTERQKKLKEKVKEGTVFEKSLEELKNNSASEVPFKKLKTGE